MACPALRWGKKSRPPSGAGFVNCMSQNGSLAIAIVVLWSPLGCHWKLSKLHKDNQNKFMIERQNGLPSVY
jgi:hypothetical protein